MGVRSFSVEMYKGKSASVVVLGRDEKAPSSSRYFRYDSDRFGVMVRILCCLYHFNRRCASYREEEVSTIACGVGCDDAACIVCPKALVPGSASSDRAARTDSGLYSLTRPGLGVDSRLSEHK